MKNEIKNFEFHLIGHHFLVELHMASFPQITKFKHKQIPNSQLLQWVEWFSKYSFETKHIAGKKNVLADFLSRSKAIAEINMYIMRHAFHIFHHNEKYKIEKIKD